MVKVKDHPSLVRDEHSKAIINTDSTGYSKYKQQSQLINDQREKISNIELELKEIKKLVSSLINK